METIHHINIIIHATAGSIALAAGFIALLSRKGGHMHLRAGWTFSWMISIVIITGLAGILLFNRNNFLLVITLLSGYTCFSGIRAIRLRGRRPGIVDLLAPVAVMAAGIYYLYYMHSHGLYWSPVVIYSTLGALFLVTVYDLLKPLLPTGILARAVLYEHTYKMVSAFSAITSAFTGTVLPQYKPYSQFLPSVAGVTCIIITFIMLGYKRIPLQSSTRL
ncbi:hypothetical protein F0L74_25580 [Chitinophaga agrisoli]|uniref:DUF2306 domain-containing protein n=1 Tax=Chitinophaga agrisoli TaxID=2607653 RepID=A0A5B2VKG7_9BACT|nr:hypothetical protein [Chitinophaga agrisoli]KAA2239571.1 hypothetical protein F0L74_25580 [Chitinophaga agrisoli]